MSRSSVRLICCIERTPGRHTFVQAPTGALTFLNLAVSVRGSGEIAMVSAEELRDAV